MSSFSIGCLVFACIFGGTLLGMILRAFLPAQHLSEESKEVVKLGMGLVATMTALVLGLLIASAKSSFDTQRNGLAELSANVILLDRVLAHYGQSRRRREMLRALVADILHRTWSQENPQSGQAGAKSPAQGPKEALFEKIQALAPRSDSQRAIQAQAMKTGIDIAQTRLLMFAQKGSSIPTPFLVLMVCWLTLILASFSLFAPSNATVFMRLASMRSGGFQCGLSDSGIGSTVRGNDSGFQRPVTHCP